MFRRETLLLSSGENYRIIPVSQQQPAYLIAGNLERKKLQRRAC
jgi:hypothetical protein